MLQLPQGNSQRSEIVMSKLLIHEPPLQVLPSLAEAIGLNEAIIIQQLHYWLEQKNSGATRDGFKWIYNSYEQWHEQFPFWSVSTIQRIFASLEKTGLIISEQLEKHRHDMTKYYRIDYAKLRMMEDVNLTTSNAAESNDVNKESETTTENTSYDRKKGIAEAKERKAKADAKRENSDPLLEFAKMGSAKEQANQAMEERIARAMHITTNDRWYRDGIIQFLIRKDAEGQSIETFAQACTADPFNMPKFFKIAEKPSLLRDTWGLAFAKEPTEPLPDYYKRYEPDDDTPRIKITPDMRPNIPLYPRNGSADPGKSG
jgi:hypothetical protein